MRNNIAIVVVAYNRLASLKRLLKSLNNAIYEGSVTLIISIDNGNNDDVVDYAKSFVWQYGEKRVVEHEFNLGLRKHILTCGEFLNEFEAIIVLEDDLVVSKYFYSYASKTVDTYKNDNRIAGISLYGFQTIYHNMKPFSPRLNKYDVYFMQNAQSWGEIWMRDQWKEFKSWYDLNNNDFGEQPHLPCSICRWKKSSWLKYHTKYCIENNKYFVYPYISFSSNVGEGGTHVSFSSPLFIVPLRNHDLYDFILPTFDSCDVKYDSFFENEKIYNHLELSKSELCIDLQGLKKNREKRRYWLTLGSANFKVIKSFGLCMRPVEENILSNIEGKDIFLYDTSVKSKLPKLDSRKVFYYRNNYDIAHIHDAIRDFGFWNYIKMMLHILKEKRR